MRVARTRRPWSAGWLAIGLAPSLACGDGSGAAGPTTGTPSTSEAGATGPDEGPPTADDTDDATGDATGDGPLSLTFAEIVVDGGLALTTEFQFVPGTMELLALAKDGRVQHLEIVGDEAKVLGSFELPGVHSDLDCGLLSLAFDPQFDDNRYVYLATCVSISHSVIYRVTLRPDDYESIGATRTEILIAGDDAAPKPWHNVGQIGFDPQGNLWALFGDKRVAANGQDLSNDLSALIRIIPSRRVGEIGHAPAADNPFVDLRGASPNVYAYGLRSPWRGLLDAQGRYWFGDVGANDVEEINVVTAPGQNFGWPSHEGVCQDDCDDVVDPIVFWPHEGTHPYQIDDPEVSPTNARVAWVGLQYAGSTIDRYRGALTGTVLFGDYCQGFVRGLDLNADGTVLADRHLGHLRLPTAWREAIDGYIYVSTFGKCETAGLDEQDPPPSHLYRVLAP